ncbi:MAG TPA: hypothetical protein VM238_18375 [Phycisphaerae bacterium]|nr:hypothetical protein [Phycisphaerae bacterium]
MRILHISDNCCIRVKKMAMAARSRGKHWIGSLSIQNVSLGDYFDEAYYFHDPDSLAWQARRIQADVYHVHNEPNYLVAKAIESQCGPVVWDVHDLDLVRFDHMPGAQNSEQEERMLAAHAEAVILPCKRYREILGLGTVLYSFCGKRHFGWNDDPKENLVLQGHVNADNRAGYWLDYRYVSEALARVGVDLHIQPAGHSTGITYDTSRALQYHFVPYEAMLEIISKHRWGLVCGGVPCPQWQAAMPNKLFEYLARGVVPVVLWADEAAEFVTKRDIGVVLEKPEDAAKVLTEGTWQRCRKNLKRIRKDLMAETQGVKLIAIYEHAIGKWRADKDKQEQEEKKQKREAAGG